MNDVNHEIDSSAAVATYLDKTKDAKPFTTLSDQPHRWQILAKSKEEVPDFEDLGWPENDLRHIPRTKEALYGVLWKSSGGSSVAMVCWTICSSILFTLGRTGERARISHNWLTCHASVILCRGGVHNNHYLHLLPNLANSPPEASSQPTPRSFASR